MSSVLVMDVTAGLTKGVKDGKVVCDILGQMPEIFRRISFQDFEIF